MHFSRANLIAVLAYGSSVLAAPAPIIAERSSCNAADAIYKVLNGPLKAQASSFCLGWLGGDKTVTGTRVRFH